MRHNLSKSPLYVYSSDQISTSSSCLHSTATNYTTCGVQRVKDARSQMLARRKVAKMLIAVVVVFGICFLPVHLLNILRSAKRSPQFAPRRARLQQNKSASTLVPRTAADAARSALGCWRQIAGTRRRQLSTDICRPRPSCSTPTARRGCCRSTRQTERRTPYRYTDAYL